MDNPNASLEEIIEVDSALRSTAISDIDRFWVKWGYLLWKLEQAGKIKERPNHRTRDGRLVLPLWEIIE